MKKLKLSTKPKTLTFREMYKLSRLKEKEESAQLISDVLELCFPNYTIEDVEVAYEKFREALDSASPFDAVITGVSDGS